MIRKRGFNKASSFFAIFTTPIMKGKKGGNSNAEEFHDQIVVCQQNNEKKEEYLFNTIDDATFFLTALRRDNYEKAHMEEIRGLF